MIYDIVCVQTKARINKRILINISRKAVYLVMLMLYLQKLLVMVIIRLVINLFNFTSPKYTKSYETSEMKVSWVTRWRTVDLTRLRLLKVKGLIRWCGTAGLTNYYVVMVSHGTWGFPSYSFILWWSDFTTQRSGEYFLTERQVSWHA